MRVGRRCADPATDRLSYKQFLMCLAAVAFRAFQGDPVSQVLGLLQLMDDSGGKALINSSRSYETVQKFNLLPLRPLEL